MSNFIDLKIYLIDSNSSNPTVVGNNITFTITWIDADQPFGETVNLYICDENGRWPNGGCKDEAYIQSYNISTNPIYATYSTQ